MRPRRPLPSTGREGGAPYSCAKADRGAGHGPDAQLLASAERRCGAAMAGRGHRRSEVVLAAVGAAWALGSARRSVRHRYRDLRRSGLPSDAQRSRPEIAVSRRTDGTGSSRGNIHGSITYPGPARPQSVESTHRHRGHRGLHRGTSARSAACPASKPGCARASRKSARCRRREPRRGDLHGPCAGARGAWPAGAGRMPGHFQPHGADARARRLSGRRSNTARRQSAGSRSNLPETLCRAAVEDAPFDLADALARLRELDEDVRLGPSTGAIVQAALCARHSLPAPDQGKPGAVRLGQPAAPHPGRRDRPHQRHFRSDCPGQGTDEKTARCRRCSSAARPAGGGCRGRLGSRL